MSSSSVFKLWTNARLATLAGDPKENPWGWVEHGAMLSQGEHLLWAGDIADLDPEFRSGLAQEHDLGGAVVTPGLIDCHTHLVYGGQRAAEFEQRLLGASYEDIARAGGGIRSSVAATRAASEHQLYAQAAHRALNLLKEGVTTLEVKSGYGLSLASEAKMLRAARRLKGLGVDVRTSYLGAHALPPEFEGRQDAYVTALIEWMTPLHREGLIDAVDAFCEGIGFSPEQTRRIFEAAQGLGLPVKLHAEQLSDQGGSQLAAEFKALSCDHLEHLSEAGVQAMAASGSVAVLLPGAYYFLRESKLPPVQALRDAGVPIAISTDHNPGTSPTLSLLLMLNMACTLFRLTPEEALRGVTVNAARALGLSDRGQLTAGQRADFCVWDVEHPNELAYYFGRNPLKRVVRGGVERA
ncbi:imidazolonepropionase [Roseateles oligotrophus]|uniref:Imidazolonepropionase n=1 Tax=Roseateles oligotrophus TaxID=1769250 RepID=A0ABT2YJS0_9BURK|nr:imidazolonepropionase [Roseateles oligotrophus]MCV2370216.1 imidazolonepropionase [Roseateles oligotrophus]